MAEENSIHKAEMEQLYREEYPIMRPASKSPVGTVTDPCSSLKDLNL